MFLLKRAPSCLAFSLAALGVAAILRIRAAHNSLWLDEIWSIELVHSVKSPLEIFSRIHSDSNHYLNSLWLRLVGIRSNGMVYRALSIAAGIGTVALAGLIGRGRSTSAAVIATGVTGVSYVLVLYASEARGYATLVFFSFLCFHLLERFLRTGRTLTAVLFSGSACLGFLSHLTFAGFFFASLAWAGFRLARNRQGYRDGLRVLALCYALPVALLAVLYAVDLRFLVVNGGATPGLAHCVLESLAWTLGHPPGITAAASGWAAVAFLIGGLAMLARSEPDSLIFFVGTTAVMPIALVLVSGSDVLYVRYFILPIAYCQLVLSFSLASFWEMPGRAGKLACALLLFAFVIANGRQIRALFAYGRGDNEGAIRLLERGAASEPVTVGGTQDFRIGTVVRFFAQAEPGGRPLRYFDWDRWPEDGVDWLISEKESYEDPRPPAPAFKGRDGSRYELAAVFPTAPLSGLQWFVYRHRRISIAP